MKKVNKFFNKLDLPTKANLIKKYYGENALKGGFKITQKVKKYIYKMEHEIPEPPKHQEPENYIRSIMKLPKKIAISLFRKKSKKSGRYWFNKMTDAEKSKFSNNIETFRFNSNLNEYLKHSYSDFEDFLGGAFIFKNSKEGDKYWFAIA